MKKILFIALAGMILAALPGMAIAQRSNATVSGQDGTFFRDAALDNQMQIKMGQLASRQGQNREVRTFGQNLVRDAMKRHQELKSLAQRKGVSLPSDLDRERQMKVDELAKKSGTDFDRAFVDLMAPAQKNQIDLYAQEVAGGRDADVQSFATKALSGLRAHQSQFDRLRTEIARK